ncbi:L,D-transpeptidase [Caldicellulosiruptor morganii]|uniref:L,D-transpeptidase n=1 Tax=Caldicellulosiruptor morganii TaxID=1387555 RepID=A0ABY7BNH0_9FIRM|nr:L,D-transpeptidase [Caldicellulosiruptor morganii]WAM34369.1 L,D-transpeptidase [Caldicellulosiruptor morganii]
MGKSFSNFKKIFYSKLLIMFLSFLLATSNLTIFAYALPNYNYITAEDFVNKLFVNLKIVDHSQDSWSKAKLLKVLPAGLNKKSIITKAQASYIIWYTIQNIDFLKQKFIPIQTNIISYWDYYKQTGNGFLNKNMPTEIVLMYYNFVVIEKIYNNGEKKYIVVWNPYVKAHSQSEYTELVANFISKNPQKRRIALRETSEKLTINYIKRVFPFIGDSKEHFSTVFENVYQSVYENIYKTTNDIEFNKIYTVAEQAYCYFMENNSLKVAKVQNFETLFLNKKYSVDVKIDPRWNRYIEDYIMSSKRDYPINHERFKYMISDIFSTTEIFQKPILYLMDLGILIPEFNQYDHHFYIFPDKKFSKTEAYEIFNRISTNNNLAFDEFKVDNQFFRIDNMRFLKMLKSLPLKNQRKLNFTLSQFGIDQSGIYIIVDDTKYYIAETFEQNGNLFYYVKPYIVLAKTKQQYKNLIPENQIVEVWSYNNGRYLVKYKNLQLYVPSKYLFILPKKKVFLSTLTKDEVEKFVNLQIKNKKSNYFIWVDLLRLSVYLMKKENNRYVLIRTMDCTAGAEHTPTLRGYFKSKAKIYKLYVPKYEAGLMYGLVYYGDYMIHSVTTDREGKIADNSILKRISHGCIRLSMSDAKYIYDHIPVGSVVWVN